MSMVDDNHKDSFFAPLADAMTIVAAIFLMIFIAVLFAYKQSIDEKKLENQKVISKLDGLKRQKMDRAMDYMAEIADDKISKIDNVNKSLILPSEFLFDTGSYILKESGRLFLANKAVSVIEKILTDQEIGNDITIAVEGHSDCQPYERDVYKNWILSSQRAISVMKVLQEKSEIIKGTNRIKAIGYGDKKPFARTEEEEEMRVKCCDIIANRIGASYEEKSKCVDKILAVDRRAEIRLEYSPAYIEDISNKYKNLIMDFFSQNE